MCSPTTANIVTNHCQYCHKPLPILSLAEEPKVGFLSSGDATFPLLAKILRYVNIVAQHVNIVAQPLPPCPPERLAERCLALAAQPLPPCPPERLAERCLC